MLNLTRRAGEKIMIGSDVIVVIKSIHGVAVEVGIEAPKDVSIHREEIYNKIKNGVPR